jgi:hypothetical protein
MLSVILRRNFFEFEPGYNSVGPANTGTTKDVYRRLCSTLKAAPKEGGRAHCEFMGEY